ncbi:hypothetical protein [Streptomyces thioluteus]
MRASSPRSPTSTPPQPKLITKAEGGSARYATTLFPKLPKGCTVVNHVK